MPGTIGARRSNRFLLTVVVLYAFVLAASAFFHRDFACRQDSRTHCIACSVSQDAQRVESHGGPVDAIRQAAGRVVIRTHVRIDTLSLTLLSDRAPPA